MLSRLFQKTLRPKNPLSFGLTLGAICLLSSLTHSKAAFAGNAGPNYVGLMCNATGESVNVAVGFRPTTCTRDGCTKEFVPYYTEGWWVVPSHTCKRMYTNTPFRSRDNINLTHTVGIYAFSRSNRWEGNSSRCVQYSAFTMQANSACRRGRGSYRGFRNYRFSNNEGSVRMSFEPRGGRNYTSYNGSIPYINYVTPTN